MDANVNTHFRVFVGYDPRQPVAFHVAAHSVWSHASAPVSITRLQLNQLPITRQGLTQFTFSRFLAPWLSNYDGISLFLDSDMLCRSDIVNLLAYPLAFPETAVFVVPHAKEFERPSVMVFNNALCTTLTPEYVQTASTKELYHLQWAKVVGELPKEWNHLVGYDAPNPLAHMVHFTQGCPCWPETKDCEFAEEWQQAAQSAIATVSFNDLMGRSVHVPFVKERLAGTR